MSALLTMSKPLTLWITTNCEKFLNRWIPGCLICLLRNLYAGQEPTVRTRHGTMDWFKIGKRVLKAVYYHPTYLTYMQSTSWEMPGWMKQESGLLGEISTTWYADDTTLRAESEEELKSLLMRVKKESEKADLKLSIQNTKIMASGPITSWQRDGEKVETVAYFIFLGSKITADGDCSYEIKICQLLGSKAMTNLDNVFERRDITLPTKVWIVKAMVFPVVER